MGVVIAARYNKGDVSYLFHQDPRFSETLPDVWLLDSDLEECERPTDEEITLINRNER
jgi:hypothetical protein